MRKTSFYLLKDHLQNDTFLNLALKNVNHPDISKITLRVYGVIENKLYLEYVISEVTNRKKLDLDTQIILMLSIYETLIIKTPKHVVISEYQKLCKKVKPQSLKYVSYFLHNLLPTEFLVPHFSNETKNLSIMYSYPQPLIKLLQQQYPQHYLDIIKHRDKDIYVRKINTLINPDDFKTTDFEDLYIANNNVVKTDDFIDGNIIIQDLGSYLVTKYLDPHPNEEILDLCAAPGNKSLQIYQSGAKLTCNEINSSRYELMVKNFNKHNANIATINCDATDLEQLISNTHKTFDKILCDVPCSGLGTINSKVEKKYKINQTNIDSLIPIQQQILNNADQLLKLHGQILYSTCSINQKENQEVIIEFLKTHNYKIIESPLLNKIIGPCDYGYTLLPYQHNSDGFFMCLLEKQE